MCMRCEGYSWDEIERHADLVIRVHGYLIQQVNDETNPWTYTVGLKESWTHPELVCVDMDADVQAVLVRAVADEIGRAGKVDDALLRELDIELLEVHDRHLTDGLVAGWESRYSRAAVTGDFLQIVPGRSWFCEFHAGRIRRLDDPDAAPAPGPNRAQRRARQRRKR